MNVSVVARPVLLYEACVDSFAAALAAEQRGAHRIELCSALDQDGLTPSTGLTRQCVQSFSTPVMAMVRPRGGDFVYSKTEISQMEHEIDVFKQLGVAGVVFGLLTATGDIDIEHTRQLLRSALPMAVTFHKAIDYSSDIMQSIRQLNEIDGITRVLTSGGCETAWDGRDVLRAMHDLPGRRIRIIAAGRIPRENRTRIADYTGVDELHGKRVV